MSLPRITRLVPLPLESVTSRITILLLAESKVTFELGQSVVAVIESPPPKILLPITLQAELVFPPISPLPKLAPDPSIKKSGDRSLPFSKSR